MPALALSPHRCEASEQKQKFPLGTLKKDLKTQEEKEEGGPKQPCTTEGRKGRGLVPSWEPVRHGARTMLHTSPYTWQL